MPGDAFLEILRPGLCTLVVDRGRPHSRSLGVPVGGAADCLALALGNALVGNEPDAAALEITLTGPSVRASAPLACVLFGAPFTLRLTGESGGRQHPLDARRPLRAGKTFTLHPGENLHIGGTATGARGYLCVAGGLQTPLILGSRSSLEPVPQGARLPCWSREISARFLARNPHTLPDRAGAVLRILEGAQTSWFPANWMQTTSFTVSPSSNRMGLRLQCVPVPVPDRELISEPVCPGTVQVTREGQCIVLGVDGQTIGGYPKIAQIIRADLDCIGQLRPGMPIRFEPVSLEEAETLYRERQTMLRAWLRRLASSS